jgi:hypothetical protein
MSLLSSQPWSVLSSQPRSVEEATQPCSVEEAKAGPSGDVGPVAWHDKLLTYDPQMTEFAVQLLNSEFKKLDGPEDIGRMDLLWNPLDTKNVPFALVKRRCVDMALDQMFAHLSRSEAAQKRYHFEGSAGTAKSTHLITLIRRVLHGEGNASPEESVVLWGMFKGQGKVSLLIRRQKLVWAFSGSNPAEALHVPEHFYPMNSGCKLNVVVDPREARQGSTTVDSVPGATVYKSTSPNLVHRDFNSKFVDLGIDFASVMTGSPWTKAELKQVAHVVGFEETVIAIRHPVVGGDLRAMTESEKLFQQRKIRIQNAARDPRFVDMEYGEVLVDTKDMDSPSAMVHLYPAVVDGKANYLAFPRAEPLSEFFMECALDCHRKAILSMPVNDRVNKFAMLEKLALHDLTKGGFFRVIKLDGKGSTQLATLPNLERVAAINHLEVDTLEVIANMRPNQIHQACTGMASFDIFAYYKEGKKMGVEEEKKKDDGLRAALDINLGSELYFNATYNFHRTSLETAGLVRSLIARDMLEKTQAGLAFKSDKEFGFVLVVPPFAFVQIESQKTRGKKKLVGEFAELLDERMQQFVLELPVKLLLPENVKEMRINHNQPPQVTDPMSDGYAKLKVIQLRDLLQKQNLSPHGKKLELIDRLRANTGPMRKFSTIRCVTMPSRCPWGLFAMCQSGLRRLLRL